MTVAAPSTNGARTTSRPAPPRPSQRPPSALELIRSADRAEEAPAQSLGYRSPPGSALRLLPRAARGALRPARSGQRPPAGAGPQPRELPRGLAGDRGSEPHLWFRRLAAPDHRRPLRRPGRAHHRPRSEARLGRHLHRPCARHRHRRRPDAPGSRGQRCRPRHRRGPGPGP